MATFQKVKIGDICELQQGLCINRKSRHLLVEHSDLPLLRITDLINDKQEQYINSSLVSPQFISDEKSLIYTRTGQVGLVFKNRKGVVYNNCFKIITKPNLDKDFLFYLLKQKGLHDNVVRIASKAAQPDLTHSAFKLIDIYIPNDVTVQTHIASILSAYDDLIENNEKRIKALEEMAKLLYIEWFVRFKFPGHEKAKMVDSNTKYGKIPEGWAVKYLGDQISIQKGKNITKSTVKEGNVPVVAGGLEPAYFHNTPNTKGPIVTISASGANAGFTRLYHEDVWASDCSFIDRTVTKHVYYYYLFLIKNQDQIDTLQRGSAQPHVYPKDLMRLTLVSAPDAVVGAFNDRVSPVFELIGILGAENQKLSKTRDLLIPQLVTGKRELK